MIVQHDIRLATQQDAQSIACLSRDCIERGLGWRWTPQRVLRSIANPSVNVAVCSGSAGLSGFGIMHYGIEDAHLLLLAVEPARRRHGVATALMAWLEASARTAGLGAIWLEMRSANTAAGAFYKTLGYRQLGRVRGMYNGVEDGARYAKDLWDSPA